MRLERPAGMRALVVLGVLATAGFAEAEVRGTVRVGMLPLDLEASADTPVFGAHVQDAVNDFNAAAAARGMSTRIDAGELGIAANLYSIAPGFEVGSGRYVFRLEGVLGVADELRSFGVGVYPLGVQGKLSHRVILCASAGGILSWLDRSGEGDVGGLVIARLAFGARLAERLLVEVGYSPFVLGGNVNQTRLDDMRSGAMPTELDGAISAGEAHGLLDVSMGLSF